LVPRLIDLCPSESGAYKKIGVAIAVSRLIKGGVSPFYQRIESVASLKNGHAANWRASAKEVPYFVKS
jgi:hypothetical protein